MTYDGTYTYQYDAEGRMVYASVGNWWQSSVYNALGQRVENVYPDGQYNRMMSFPRDILGRRTGIFDDRPSINWVGWDQFWARVAGERVLMGGSTSWLRHGDAAGSTTMETDQTGAVDGDVAYYPWGKVWQQTGSTDANAFGDLGFQVNNPQPPAMHRDLNPLLGRWLTPDPGGRKVVNLADPQTWNMYAYVTNNPASLNDPSGLAGQQGPVSTCIPNDNHCAAPIVSEIFTTANAQNQTLAQQQNQTAVQRAGQVVFGQVKEEFPGVTFDQNNVQVLGAHNGHENIVVTGTGSKDQIAQVQKTLQQNKGLFGPGSRINITIGKGTFALHVERLRFVAKRSSIQ